MSVNWANVQVVPNSRGVVDWPQVVRAVLSGLVVPPLPEGQPQPDPVEWREQDVAAILMMAGADEDGNFPSNFTETRIKANLEAAIARVFVGFNLP